MKRIATVNGVQHEVVIERHGDSWEIQIDGRTISADLRRANDSIDSLRIDGRRQYAVVHHQNRDRHEVYFPNFRVDVDLHDPLALASRGSGDAGAHEGSVCAIMPGRVVRVEVEEGAEVERGQTLVVVEAMKMENAIEAPRAGKVTVIHVGPGDTVESGAELVTIE